MSGSDSELMTRALGTKGLVTGAMAAWREGSGAEGEHSCYDEVVSDADPTRCCGFSTITYERLERPQRPAEVAHRDTNEISKRGMGRLARIVTA